MLWIDKRPLRHTHVSTCTHKSRITYKFSWCDVTEDVEACWSSKMLLLIKNLYWLLRLCMYMQTHPWLLLPQAGQLGCKALWPDHQPDLLNQPAPKTPKQQLHLSRQIHLMHEKNWLRKLKASHLYSYILALLGHLWVFMQVTDLTGLLKCKHERVKHLLICIRIRLHDEALLQTCSKTLQTLYISCPHYALFKM